ncbi:MAG: dihydroorotase family protein [Promethearchaeota archaeon]
MILINAKIFVEGLIRTGIILINNGTITKIRINPDHKEFKSLIEKNRAGKEIDCENKLILPGIIDIHSHLRDMGQSEKETFVTGTKAAAYSGITTVFNMPNTKPPAITEKQVRLWMEKAQKSIYTDVGFIAGVPKGIDEDEIKSILKLGVIGFKIYPASPLNEVNWEDSVNVQKLLRLSSKYQVPIFIHAAYNISDSEKERIIKSFENERIPLLELHDKLNPVEKEEECINFIIKNYEKLILENNLGPNNYPIIHFCHVSTRNAYLIIKNTLNLNKEFKISFEVTPHHLLLASDILLNNNNHGKVLPPLRKSDHSQYLFKQLESGNIPLIGSDHAPHTLTEKSKDYFNSPSGFPGYETYPLVLIDKIFNYKLSFENFIKASSENPALLFRLNNKGFIKEGYDADLMIIDKVPEYNIDYQKFFTKAKYTPFENYSSTVKIWKVLLRGVEINNDDETCYGKIIKASYNI